MDDNVSDLEVSVDVQQYGSEDVYRIIMADNIDKENGTSATNDMILQTLLPQNEMLMSLLTTNARNEEVYFSHDFSKSLSVFNVKSKPHEVADWLKALCGVAKLNRW